MTIEVLLGDEALALGAIHAGISGAFAYPGTPSTEIFEFVERRVRQDSLSVHARWSPNEKVAYEEALGMSWAGRRAMVSMKHVGLNVAADAFVNSALTGVGGGLAVVVADDPGMHSSQNEQDTRLLAQFALTPCLEPRNQQQAYDVMAEALALSERLDVPVVVRLVTRLAHSRAAVALAPEARPQNPIQLPLDTAKWTLLPGHARNRFRMLVDRQPALKAWSEASPLNPLTLRGRSFGVVAAGIAANYLEENLAPDHEVSTLLIGAYPLPEAKLRALVEHCDTVLVLEDGSPLIEQALTGLFGPPTNKQILGRLSGALPRTGELDPDSVATALGRAPRPTQTPRIPGLPGRPPVLCQGCPHADLYAALTAALTEYPGSQVLADIGCYTLGALPPVQAIHSCVCMGASVGMAMGAAHAGVHPVCSVIGDGTFGHGGLPGLLVAARNDDDLNLIILDNEYVAMTGGQESFSCGEPLDRLLLGLGVKPEHLRIITPLKKHHEENVRILREEIAHRGLSVIIARRPCIQKK